MENNGILVWLETAKGRLAPLAKELAAQARRLSAGAGLPALGLIMEHEAPQAAELQTLPLDRVFIQQLCEPGFSAQNFADALLETIRLCRPAAVLIGASDRGKDVAPLAAAKLGTGLTADCVDLRLEEDGNLLQIRPAFGGNVMAEILTPSRRPQFVTVRPGAFKADPARPAAAPKLRQIQAPPPRPDIKILEIQAAPPATLAGAGLVIAVGRGFKSAADLAPIKALAAACGAELGGSRAVVERGWLPPEAQIGLSGHSIAPRLLITLGISGSVQFLAGIRGAKRLVAVNSDPAAPVFSAAHRAICADIYQILPYLEEWLHDQELLGSNNARIQSFV